MLCFVLGLGIDVGDRGLLLNAAQLSHRINRKQAQVECHSCFFQNVLTAATKNASSKNSK